MQRNNKIFELTVSILLFCLGGFLIFVANTTGMPSNDGMSSMDFPRAIFGVIMVFSLYIMVNSILWFRKNPKQPGAEKVPLMKKKAALTFLFICIYAAMWKVVGFSISTLVFFIAEARLLDSKRPLKMAVLIGICATVLMVLVFGVLFKVQFPEPILEMIRGY